jgi:hypothetical protein
MTAKAAEEISMKNAWRYAATVLVAVLALYGCENMPGHAGGGWTTVLDGSNPATLANWNRIGDANWRVEDGAVVADRGKGGYLVSKKSYRDFQIRAEFWAADNTNSGIFIRAGDPNKIGGATAYEVNIYDQRPDPSYGTGAIVGVAKVSPMQKAGGKWNTYLITARGNHLTVELNGQRTADADDSKHASGPIALQYGSGPKDAQGGPIKWRKVEVREL